MSYELLVFHNIKVPLYNRIKHPVRKFSFFVHYHKIFTEKRRAAKNVSMKSNTGNNILF